MKPTALPKRCTRQTALRCALIAAIALTTSACMQNENAGTELRHALSRIEHSDPQAIPTVPETSAGQRSARTDAAAEAHESNIPAPNSLDELLREALERNPSLKSAAARVRAALERIPQATALPDPMLRTAIRPEPIQTAAGDVDFTLAVSQTIPLLTRLQRRGDVAAAGARVELAKLIRTRVELVGSVQRTWWQMYRLDRNIEITGENTAVLEDVVAVARRRYEVGTASQADLLRAETELESLRDDLHRMTLQREAVAAAINDLANRPVDREIPKTTEQPPPKLDRTPEQLTELADNHSPVLEILREEVVRNQRSVELEQLASLPDLTVGFEWNHLEGRRAFQPPVNPQTGMRPTVNESSEAGDDNWAVTLQLNLPIWTNRIAAAEREAKQRLLAARHDLSGAASRTAYQVRDAWSRIEARRNTLSVIDEELLPRSQQAFESAVAEYQTGKTDFNALVDTWRRLLGFEMARHTAVADLHTAVADLEQIVGANITMQSTENTPAGNQP